MTQDNSIATVEVKKSYYESGALLWEIPYVNGNKHGIERGYDNDNSNIHCLSLYDKGQTVASVRI